MTLRILDLCAGIGGFSYAAEYLSGGRYETAGFVEIDKHCQLILKKRWPGVPVYNNIKEYEYDPQTDGLIDIITAGYPCQPFSTAGSLKGEDDPRHLWPDVFRIVKSIRPTWCIFENVPNHINMGFATVRDDMESQGYQIQALVIPAIAADANHIRDRLWIICTKEAATNKDENHYYKLSHKINPGVKVQQIPEAATEGRNLLPTICARDWKGKAINARSRLPNAIGDGERERLIWRTPDTGAGGNAYNNLSKGITHRLRTANRYR